jgi:hypothetical protein
MTAKFTIQTRTSTYEIWHTPLSPYDDLRKAGPVESDSVDELRGTLAALADSMTLSWWHHFRIITADGAPVERWKIRPGEARRTAARY